ncbi:GDSL-like Lipase/Acylhydrolase superfamily protein [Arabidopsis thaliana]|uniref:Anther-specific proline-rich protein APG n=1 Tax=Arabidopsis thaliana TaxID=3702 RepID=APG_ARATH|nr:GDSL-like Lipase/Acylhydrolase superfamily protein [Arabidopsis thaliana]P40602.2 RecName: Full=Anther-specific proline-rich protein APG; Flags: Precursor [Arabidopsis thaliana]AAL24235.1 At1g20130/T20H2_9 [Arabidopsis thaliana]AAP37660.1 At1g20130/T20H2_9 [Arabidopsis thaliana]AEE29939.1 GDSL-like Lipase/Acylhydrolase superfamily protein [Arabidopsis thaliana]|eukprot:NP_173441.2 GDSL-like Lipase/Acylhydrolase superfamily protein [Arabidopsis thaliana]
MKRSSLVDSCSYSRIFRSIFCLLSFCIFFLTTTNAQVMHRRLWPWPLWPRPYPQPWPMNPPTPDPSPKPVAPPGPSSKPVAPPGPSPCPSPPPKPQPKPPPAPSPSPCPSPPPKPQPKPVPPPACPPTPPKPQPKPAPPPEPKPAPPPAPKPVPCPSPPKPPAPTPKPVPPHGPPPKPAPAPTPAPSPKPAPSPPKPENKTIPAVFFFGDSVFDTGNNNNLETKIKSNYRPYGMDFKFRVATGRFSNGMVASDYLAKYMGVKEIVPAYLDPKIQPNDLLTGVSFASGGAGYNPTTSEAANAIPMLDQLTYFQDYIEKVNRLVRQEKSQYKLAGLEKTNQLISKGVAIVVGGSNDLIITYFGSGAQRLKNDIDSYTTIIADSAASFVLQLYGYGARRIGVIGTPPLGCVPSQRLKKKKICNEELNYASQLFNSKLLLILGQLSKTLPNSTFVYMDIYTIISQMLETPAAYGFEETKKPCCKTGLLSAGALCKKSTSKICPNTSSYLFWDGVHPTQRAYKTINKVLIKEYLHVLSK